MSHTPHTPLLCQEAGTCKHVHLGTRSPEAPPECAEPAFLGGAAPCSLPALGLLTGVRRALGNEGGSLSRGHLPAERTAGTRRPFCLT